MAKPFIMYNGLGGQVGNSIQALENDYPQFDFLGLSHKELDLREADKIDQLFEKYKPSFFLQIAAYTAVDKAETDIDDCRLINAISTNIIAKACKKHQVKMVYVSSDYVYHSTVDEPIKETDANEPKGVYAITKLEGEIAIQNNLDNYYIFRTSWVYDSFGQNFVNTMVRLGNKLDHLKIVSDQIGTPTYAPDIAKSIMEVVQQNIEKSVKHYGVYNLSNQSTTNWASFAEEIFVREKIQCEITGISTEEFGAKAPRPKWSVLDCTKIKLTFGIELPTWNESLQTCLDNRSKE